MGSTHTSPMIAHHQFCVLYESASGKILSVYESITLEGAGPAPRPQDIESRAKALSSQFMRAQSKRPFDENAVQTLLVGPEAFKTPGPKKVDLKRLAVVPAEK
jgi:hypothetical protein